MSLSDYKIILDFPSDKPALGFANTADALKDIVESSRPQFAVGIFGTWGSGKTTLMRAIEKRLDPAKSIAVQFSAWRYEREPHLIVPLLDTVREALAIWAEKNAAFKDEALKTASTVGKAMYSLLTGLSFKFGVPGAVELSFKANAALEQAKKFTAEEKEAKVSRSFYHATFRALRESFHGFLGDGSSRRIIVFVDDLDRCLPQGALEVLEAMKLFFDLEGFRVHTGRARRVAHVAAHALRGRDGVALRVPLGSFRNTRVLELVEGDMHRRVAAAPAAPGTPRLEDAQRPGQVIGLVPMIEARPLGFGDLGAHREKRFCHARAPGAVRRRCSNRRS